MAQRSAHSTQPKIANAQIADHLEAIGQLLSMSGESRFKVIAFTGAAEKLREFPARIEQASDLRGMRGFGDSTLEVIARYLATGTSSRLQELERTVAPVSVLTMTAVRGIGPKKALALYREGFRSLDDLAAAARRGALDPALAAEVLVAVDVTKNGRWILKDAEAAAGVVHATLAALPLTSFTACGSLRRGRPTVGDLDYVAHHPHADQTKQILRAFQSVAEASGPGGGKLTLGSNRASTRWILWGRPIQVDLWIVAEESYGAAVLYATGSKEHGIMLRKKAQARRATLNEYGLWTSDHHMIAGRTEEEIYGALGFDYILPKDREEVL
jgi:DNA polymerase (family 10)